jgi:hypothetical protein
MGEPGILPQNVLRVLWTRNPVATGPAVEHGSLSKVGRRRWSRRDPEVAVIADDDAALTCPGQSVEGGVEDAPPDPVSLAGRADLRLEDGLVEDGRDVLHHEELDVEASRGHEEVA